MPRGTLNDAIIDATIDSDEAGRHGPARSRYQTPIANVPLIEHVLHELAGSEIRQARIIAGRHLRDDLQRLTAHAPVDGIELSFADAPGGRRDEVLRQLQSSLHAGPVLLHPGDCLYRGQLLAMKQRFEAGDVDVVLPEQAPVGPSATDTERRASEAILLLAPAARPVVDYLLSPEGEDDDLVAALLDSDCRMAVCGQTENWSYSDSTVALLAANRMLLDALPSAADCESDGEGNQITGRVQISPRSHVSNSVIYGPVSIGDRAVVVDSFLGPYTAVGPDAVVSGTEVDNSMILAGAVIRHVGFRIGGSIIGERARVGRGLTLPRGIQLRIGPDAEINLS